MLLSDFILFLVFFFGYEKISHFLNFNESQEIIIISNFFFLDWFGQKYFAFWFHSVLGNLFGTLYEKLTHFNTLRENHPFSSAIIFRSLGWFLLKVKSSLIYRNIFFRGLLCTKFCFLILFLAIYIWNTLRENHPFSTFLVPLFWKSGVQNWEKIAANDFVSWIVNYS